MKSVSTKSLAIMAVLAICATSCFGMVLVSEDSDAANVGTSSNPAKKWIQEYTYSGSVISTVYLDFGSRVDVYIPVPDGAFDNFMCGVITYDGNIWDIKYSGSTGENGIYVGFEEEFLCIWGTAYGDVWVGYGADNLDAEEELGWSQVVHIVVSGGPDQTITVPKGQSMSEEWMEEGWYGASPSDFWTGSFGKGSYGINATIDTEPDDGRMFLTLSGTPNYIGTGYYTLYHKTGGNFNNLTEVVTYQINVVDAPPEYRHTVHYDANGGSGAPADTVVKNSTNGNTTVTLSSTQPTKSGYTFAGWYTAATGGSKVTSVSVGANATTTVYAHWTQNTLSIGSVAKQYSVVGKSVSFSASCSSTPSGASVSYSATNVQSGLTVNVSGSTVTCSASSAGTYTFTLNASASNYAGSSTTVTVQFVPVLAFSNTPSAGALNA